MTAVFVHGVPETALLWDGVRARLDVDSVAVALPGFGNPRPPGFAATKDAYAHWLADEIRRIGPPVDLVGHDWAALLTLWWPTWPACSTPARFGTRGHRSCRRPSTASSE